MTRAVSFPTILTHIAGTAVTDLARQFGTPCYVYDAAKVVERIGDLAAFDVVRYAVKACSNLAIVDLIRRHGALVETVSAGEICRALAAGYTTDGDPPAIIYTADIFDREALELVVKHGLHVNCGSPDMIDQLGRRTPGRAITLRINPGFGHGHSRKTNTGGAQSKHGIWHEQLPDCLRRAAQYGLTVTGLHMHIGSGTDFEHLSRVSRAMEQAATQVGDRLRSVSAGGGLPVPYRDGEMPIDLEAYYEIWHATRQRLAQSFGHSVRLEIEPGRYVVAESGYLICEIRAIKQMGPNTFYLVDAGFNNLARPILYGAYHPIAIAPAPGQVRDRSLRPVVVGGPLCESGDIFTQEEGGFVAPRQLPEAEIGDLLVIQNAGAYGFVMSSNYCAKMQCAEVLLHAGQIHRIRARQTP
ncbi:MAG: diaminopimelate decarboxylase, partial [Planctomycetes bacterium RBG_16_64_10]